MTDPERSTITTPTWMTRSRLMESPDVSTSTTANRSGGPVCERDDVELVVTSAS
jgi:hypothetical protein